jgi:aminopeptidase-like protein
MEKIKETIDLCKRFVYLVEHNYFPCRTYTGNLFLSKYGLYEDLNVDDTIEKIQFSFEGNKSVLDISRELSVNFDRVVDYAKNFHAKGLVTLDYVPQTPPLLR